MTEKEAKVIGELSDSGAVGLLGINMATEGEAIGVYGETESDEGYGLYTPDDAHVGGNLSSKSVSTETSRSNKNTIGTSLNESVSGPSIGVNSRSYTNQFREMLGTIPAERTKPMVVIWTDRLDAGENDRRTYDEFTSRRLPINLALTPGDFELEDNLDHIQEFAARGASVGYYSGSERHWYDDVDSIEDLEHVGWEAKQAIEDKGFNVNFMSPRGGSGSMSALPPQTADSPQARAIESLFVASGHSNVHGVSEIGNIVAQVGPHLNNTGEDENMTASDVQDYKDGIDDMIQAGSTAVRGFFFHARSVGDNWDNMTDWLDYLQQKRDAGDIQVVTPTMAVCAARDPADYNVIQESSPQFSNASDSFWGPYGNYPDVRNFDTDPYWELGATDAGDDFSGLRARRFDLPRYAGTIMIQFDARSPTGETNNIEIRIDNWDVKVDGDWTGDWPSGDMHDITTDDTWSTHYAPLGFPRTAQNLIGESLSGGEIAIWAFNDNVHVRNIKMYPI